MFTLFFVLAHVFLTLPVAWWPISWWWILIPIVLDYEMLDQLSGELS